MAQFHDAPARYLALMRDALPAYDRMQDALAQATADVAATRILDLGTGTGETARRVLAAHPGAHVVGLDASADMLGLAQALLGERLTPHLARLGEPLPDGPFDLVVSALAVHHLDGPGKAALFADVAACLAPGGRFAMADVIVPEAPVELPSPLDPAIDLPDRLGDLLSWLRDAGLEPAVRWAEGDLAVVAASR
ncbi:MAG: class I SAM-dependent methyltransferase [Solirubrobacteraceae bacterium]